MKMNNLTASCSFVKVINILCNNCYFVCLFQFGNHKVCFVGICFSNSFP